MEKNNLSIAIIGAGMSGLCMGIKLKEAGFDNFTIYEKSDNVGGTWRDNIYPGLCCDVPSHLYSYSFEPNPEWSHLFSPGKEIQEYFEHCAKKYNITPHLKLSSELVDARYDEKINAWHLTSANGETNVARVVITGMGALHHPKLPDIPGRDSFAGTAFHSAQWNAGHSLKGERVAVIGSAASAIQIVPNIAPEAGEVHLFQRTPNWIRPREDFGYPEKMKERFRKHPFFIKLHRWMIYWRMENRFSAFRPDTKRNAQERRECLEYMESVIGDPKMRRALTPHYEVGCKRILVSDDFYDALNRPNVHLVTDGIERITPSGIVLETGDTIEVDTIIYATGFKATEPLAHTTVKGLGGLSLSDAWKEGNKAMRTVSVPEFPNFFMLLGPNSGLGHNSIIFMVEEQARYITKCLRKLVRTGASYMAPKREAAEKYDEMIHTDMESTIWKSGCESWYQDEHGNVTTLWPHGTVRYRLDMRTANTREYELHMAS